MYIQANQCEREVSIHKITNPEHAILDVIRDLYDQVRDMESYDNEDDIKVTEEASLNLINKDFENEVEISFNAETPYELDCINHIFTLLSMNIMNMSDAW